MASRQQPLQLFPETIRREWLNRPQKSFAKGQMIVTPGDSPAYLYLIVAGNARLFHLHLDGKECTLDILSAGDFINWLNLFIDREKESFCRALTDVTVVSVPKKEIFAVIESTPPGLAMSLLKDMALRLQETTAILEQVAYGKVEERIVFLFEKLTEGRGQAGECVPLPPFLTHKDLAGMIGSTRETVTFLLNKLQQEGVVVQKDNQLLFRKGAQN